MNKNNEKQVAFHLTNATITGTMNKNNKGGFRNPVVEFPFEGQLSITNITRQNGSSSTKQVNWLKKHEVFALKDYCKKQYGLTDAEVVCVVNTMDGSPRNGHYLCGGTFAHPFIATAYQLYLNCDPRWRDIKHISKCMSIVEQSENIASKAITPKPQITTQSAIKAALKSPKIGIFEGIFDTLTSTFETNLLIDGLQSLLDNLCRANVGDKNDWPAEALVGNFCISTIKQALEASV